MDHLYTVLLHWTSGDLLLFLPPVLGELILSLLERRVRKEEK